MEYDENQQRKGDENIIKFIDQQIAYLGDKLRESEDSLTMLNSGTNYMGTEEFEKNLFENVNEIQDKVIELNEEIRVLEYASSKLQNEPSRLEVYRLLPEMLGKSYESYLGKKIDDLLDLLEQKENLMFEVTNEHSGMKLLTQKILLKTQSIRKSISVIEDRLNDEIRYL